MKHPAAVFDYTIWILQAVATLLLAAYLFRKTSIMGVNHGLIRKLVLLLIAESFCTIVFEFMFAFGSQTTFQVLVSSFMIGGEATFKGISLCLFAFKYLNASLESPDYTNMPNGTKKFRLANVD